ncbi:hypothetical protein V3O24_05270 [Methylobacter sp. Wu8]|uniref:GFA family protein n=1 Tax=Methylobacter sp. Wu8 TaxID=3118457 RepID=UPI002F2C9264
MKGSCLCGAIEYEIDSIDMPVAHCHCRTCQKAHAAPFASTAAMLQGDMPNYTDIEPVIQISEVLISQ